MRDNKKQLAKITKEVDENNRRAGCLIAALILFFFLAVVFVLAG